MALEKETRFGDMHRTRSLVVYRQFGGDVVLTIVQDGDIIGDDDFGDPKTRAAMIEFTVSGGQSPNTLNALINLRDAMAKDNAERPQDRS
jgi:hypothetical protein